MREGGRGREEGREGGRKGGRERKEGREGGRKGGRERREKRERQRWERKRKGRIQQNTMTALMTW